METSKRVRFQTHRRTHTTAERTKQFWNEDEQRAIDICGSLNDGPYRLSHQREFVAHGIRNFTRAICFCIAPLQALLATRPFVDIFLDLDAILGPTCHHELAQYPVTHATIRLVRDTWRTPNPVGLYDHGKPAVGLPGNCLEIRSLRDAMRGAALLEPLFIDRHEQQDAESFLQAYLYTLEEELRQIRSNIMPPQVPEHIESFSRECAGDENVLRELTGWKYPTSLFQAFSGSFQVASCCTDAYGHPVTNVTIKEQLFLTLTLGTNTALREYLVPEGQLPASSHSGLYHKRQQILHHLPPVLVVCLMHEHLWNKRAGEYKKYCKTIDIDPRIVFYPEYLTYESRVRTEYKLKSIVMHRGDTLSSGHYFTYALHPGFPHLPDLRAKDQWMLFDDHDQVLPVDETALFNSLRFPGDDNVTPYLLFYEKIRHSSTDNHNGQIRGVNRVARQEPITVALYAQYATLRLTFDALWNHSVRPLAILPLSPLISPSYPQSEENVQTDFASTRHEQYSITTMSARDWLWNIGALSTSFSQYNPVSNLRVFEFAGIPHLSSPAKFLTHPFIDASLSFSHTRPLTPHPCRRLDDSHRPKDQASLTSRIHPPAPHMRTQERLFWLLDEYCESTQTLSTSLAQNASKISSRKLATNVFATSQRLIDLPLSKAAQPLQVLYPDMPREVLAAWWEQRNLMPSTNTLITAFKLSEKENVPSATSSNQIPITTPRWRRAMESYSFCFNHNAILVASAICPSV
ncbi:cysteine proteinase [Hymenopellis radicata]|nr:cysteine proteinase [Hymenopellis radicata]